MLFIGVSRKEALLLITKAMEIVSDVVRFQHSASPSDEGDALRLSYQALRSINVWRDDHDDGPLMQLPGETYNPQGRRGNVH